jgi:hypothetical protein
MASRKKSLTLRTGEKLLPEAEGEVKSQLVWDFRSIGHGVQVNLGVVTQKTNIYI